MYMQKLLLLILLKILFLDINKYSALCDENSFYIVKNNEIFEIAKSDYPIWRKNDKQVAEFIRKPIIFNYVPNGWKLTHSYDGPVTELITDRRVEKLPCVELNKTDIFRFNHTLQCEWIYIKTEKIIPMSYCKGNNYKSVTLKVNAEDPVILLPEYKYYYTKNVSQGIEQGVKFPVYSTCLAFFATVCHCCLLKVEVKYGLTTTQTLKIQNTDNKWTEYKMFFPNTFGGSLKITFSQTVFSKNCTYPYFAFDELRTCYKTEYRARLVDSKSSIAEILRTTPINFFPNCSNNGLGVNCLSCEDISSNNNCSAMKICEGNLCSCTPGYSGILCTDINCIDPDIHKADLHITSNSLTIVYKMSIGECTNIKFKIIDEKENSVCIIGLNQKCENLEPAKNYGIYLISYGNLNDGRLRIFSTDDVYNFQQVILSSYLFFPVLIIIFVTVILVIVYVLRSLSGKDLKDPSIHYSSLQFNEKNSKQEIKVPEEPLYEEPITPLDQEIYVSVLPKVRKSSTTESEPEYEEIISSTL